MTAEMITNYLRNGKQNGQNGYSRPVKTETSHFWDKIQINEWTFSLFLFVLSLSITVGKLYINYGSVTVVKSSRAIPDFSQMYDAFAVPRARQLSGFSKEDLKNTSEKLMNASRVYRDAMAGAVVGIGNRVGYLIRAALCGLAMMGFTWFIIYKDSRVPGVNPPSPFSPTKSYQRYPVKSRLQINYLVGVVNGILIFVYMCL